MSWPLVQTDVDDFRDATEDEVEYCDYCEEAVFEGELQKHCGERRCEDCRFLCPICHDADVYSEPEFCEYCAMWALGVEI